MVAIGDDRRVDFMGCPLDALTMEQTVERAAAMIEQGGVHGHMCLSAHKFHILARDPALRAALRNSDLISADGVGIVLGARILGAPVPERVTGIDLMLALVARAEERGWKPYFLGSRQEIVTEVARRLQARHPRLRIAGCRNGYFGADEEREVVRRIRQSGANLLFIALETPQKEIFQDTWLEALGVPFVMGVGGAFDVIAGRKRRSPAWARRYGLEWAYRWAQEPRRRAGRVFFGSASFAALLLRARLWGHRLRDP